MVHTELVQLYQPQHDSVLCHQNHHAKVQHAIPKTVHLLERPVHGIHGKVRNNALHPKCAVVKQKSRSTDML